MNDDEGLGIEPWLAWEVGKPAPGPRRDLVALVTRRAHNWLLVRELLQLVTLEALWKSMNRHEVDAQSSRERQDS